MDDYVETLRDHIDNIQVSADSHLYILTEYLRSKSSKQLINKELMDKLDSTNEKIEEICTKNFENIGNNLQTLIDSEQEVKNISFKLDKSLSIMHHHSSNLLSIKEKIAKSKMKLKNVENLTEILNICLPALRVFDSLKQDMASKHHISCIDNLVKLENEYLPKITGHSFAKKIATALIDLKSKLKSNIFTELKTFLIATKNSQEHIGEVVCQKLSDFDNKYMKIIDIDINEYLEMEDLLTCNYVFASLNNHQEFINFYRSQRKKQVILIINWHSKDKIDQESLQNYFFRLIGFFIIEDKVFQMIQSLTDISYMKILWEDSCNYLSTAIRNILSENYNENLANIIKNNLKYMQKLTMCLHLDKDPLYKIIDGITKVYETNILIEYSKILAASFRSETFEPIMMRVASDFKYSILMDDPGIYPYRVDFSSFAVTLSEIIVSCLSKVHEFMRDMYPNQTQIYEMLLETLKLFFSDYLPDSLLKAKFEQISIVLFTQLLKDILRTSKSLKRILQSVRKMVSHSRLELKPDFPENELVMPALNLIRNNFGGKIERHINGILKEGEFATEFQNDSFIINRISDMNDNIFSALSNLELERKLFFLKRIFNDFSNTLLLAIRNILVTDKVNFILFPLYNTIYCNIEDKCKNMNSQVHSLFLKYMNQFLLIISAFNSWDWESFVQNYSENVNDLKKINPDHLKLVRLVLSKLDMSSIPETFKLGSDNGNAVESANKILNAIK